MTYVKNISFQNSKLRLSLNSDADESVLSEIFFDREYRSLEAIIRAAKDPIIDIGAHIGLFTIYARTFNPTASIFAFEPEERNFALLKENLKLNHISKVVVKNLAVAGASGHSKLYVHQDSHNHSLIDAQSSMNTKIVQAISLQEIIQKNRFEKISLVKMDCEGAEFEIIDKTPKEVFDKVSSIYIEYHQYHESLDPTKIVKKLEQNSFSVESKSSRHDQRFGFILAKKIKNL